MFFIVSVFVISGIIFNDKLIGRSLDFPVPPVSYLVKNNYLMNFYSWWGTMNGGGRNAFGGALIPVNSILYFPLLFDAGTWFIGRYQIILTLFSAMFFFYLLSERLIEDHDLKEKDKVILSVISSLFFALNNYFFSDIIFGSNAQYFTFSLTPLLTYSLISYFKYRQKKYFFLSFLSLFIISSTLQHLILAYALIFLFSLVYRDYKFFLKLGVLHFLLSLYWILPLFYVSPEIIKTELAVDYTSGLVNSSSKFYSALINSEYFANRNLYNLALNNKYLSFIWFFNATLLVAVSLISLFKARFFTKRKREIILGFSLMFLFSLFFVKGGREPFGNAVLFLYEKVPFFKLYRSLQHYLGFYVIAISALFLFSGSFLIQKNRRFALLLFALIFINAMPWWYSLDLGAKNITSTNQVSSYFNQFYLTEGNENMYALNNLPLDFGVMHVPPGHSINFFAVGKNEFNFITRPEGKIKSQGGDEGLYYGNKKFYATDGPANNLTDVLDDMEKDMYTREDFFDRYKNIFPLLNIRYFVIRDDAGPVFSKNKYFFNTENIKIAAARSDFFSSLETKDFITIAKSKDFLPHFYTPKDVITSGASVKSLLDIVSMPDRQIRSVIFFKNQNNGKLENLEFIANNNGRILEFKKINLVKYRVRAHYAEGRFPLVFSESFHKWWKAYLVKNQKSKIKNQNPEFYKISDGNEEEQASETELRDYVDNGWVSDLGKEKYKIDFISKNFQGTIQNDNLPKGKIWETWFKKPLSEENHLMANGYANSWIINTDEICKEADKCVKNSDGTYDLELVIEYWPQRLFYLGLFVSGLTVFGSFGYLFFDYRRRKKENKNAQIQLD